MRDLRPNSLEEIIAGISLYRPGPMDKIPVYIANKRNPAGIKYDHPLLEPTLKVTFGIMVYQEQVMRIVQDVAGYSLGRADEVRRMMSKKKKDKMEKEREIFLSGLHNDRVDIKGAVANGVSKEIANKIYDDMSTFASYAFNKSHAAAYAYLAYQTAYLKCYYTVEFVTAVLNNRITSIEEISNYLNYLKERGFKVLPPNINRSYAEFSVEDGGVRIGMAAIKNVGISVIENIVAEREKGGDFKDFVEFVKRMQDSMLNKKQLESLIYAGTFDCFGLNRSQLIAVYEQILDRVARDRQQSAKGQISFFDNIASDFDKFDYPALEEYELSEKLAKEKEVAGVYLTGHPLEQYKEHLKKYSFNTSMLSAVSEDDEGDGENYVVPDDTTVTIGGQLTEAAKKTSKKTGKEFGIGKLEDLYGTVELMLGGYKLSRYKNVFVKDKLVTVTGKVRHREDTVSVSVDSIESWDGVKKGSNKKICFYLSFTESDESVVDMLQNILKAYPGEDETYIKNTDDNKIYPLGINTSVNPLMYNELCGLIGEKNIKVG